MLKIRPTLMIACVGLVFTGCATAEDVDATHLTVVTTQASLDHATALAVAEYVSDQDIEVTLEQRDDPDAVFAALEPESDTPSGHERIGVVTVPQDSTSEDTAPQISDTVEVLSQAPVELDLRPIASTVTAARFTENTDTEAEEPLTAACTEHTWLQVHALADDMAVTSTALAELGCEPNVETISIDDRGGYDQLAHRLTVEPDTVALLFGVDPIIVDEGLTTLEVSTETWPSSSVVAVASPEVEDPLTEHIGTVFETLDNEAATSLLRGYHNGQTSSSDLDYEVEHAIRHWLATHGLADSDTVIEISTDEA